MLAELLTQVCLVVETAFQGDLTQRTGLEPNQTARELNAAPQ
jgi:hypothetical protein